MKTRNGASVLTVLLAFCGAVDARPPDYTVQFNLRETAGDPTSDIAFSITLGLMNESQDGDSIGWDVIVVTIRDLDENGAIVDRWSMAHPFVDTADGLWWIEHADPGNPSNSEFALVPRIQDTAPSPDPGVSDLDFDFQGNSYSAPPGGLPFSVTASLDCFLRLAETPQPAAKEDEADEPVEVPEMPEEPYPV